MSVKGSDEHKETTKDLEEFHPRINELCQKFLDDLMEEKQRLGEDFPLCALLIEDGKILGPKGNCLRRLHAETQCKITLKGRNSSRNPTKEEELRNSGDPRYAHYNKDLYVEISTIATPAESYARIAYALAEIRKYIIPDKNDEVSQEQLREMMEINPESVKAFVAKPNVYYKSVLDKGHDGNDGSKYMSLIKKTSYHPQYSKEIYEQEPDEEIYEYSKPYVVKRQPVYEYTRVRPYVPAFKRAQRTVYDTEIKRTREATATPYKPSPYAILTKYK